MASYLTKKGDLLKALDRRLKATTKNMIGGQIASRILKRQRNMFKKLQKVLYMLFNIPSTNT